MIPQNLKTHAIPDEEEGGRGRGDVHTCQRDFLGAVLFINPIGASDPAWGAIATVRGRCPGSLTFVRERGSDERN